MYVLLKIDTDWLRFARCASRPSTHRRDARSVSLSEPVDKRRAPFLFLDNLQPPRASTSQACHYESVRGIIDKGGVESEIEIRAKCLGTAREVPLGTDETVGVFAAREAFPLSDRRDSADR